MYICIDIAFIYIYIYTIETCAWTPNRVFRRSTLVSVCLSTQPFACSLATGICVVVFLAIGSWARIV